MAECVFRNSLCPTGSFLRVGFDKESIDGVCRLETNGGKI